MTSHLKERALSQLVSINTRPDGVAFDVEVGLGCSVRGLLIIEPHQMSVRFGELFNHHTGCTEAYETAKPTNNEVRRGVRYFAASMVYQILLEMAYIALNARVPNRKYLPSLRNCAEIIVARHERALKMHTSDHCTHPEK